MPIQGWQNARLCTRWRDIWMHEPRFWPLGPQTQSSGKNRTETGTEERHWSTGDGAGHCLECGEEKGMTQALFLPTRSLKSRERAKDINIWHGRWQNVSSGSGFWQLEVFLVFLHSKLSLSGRKKTHYQHLEKDFYLWPKVSLSVFSVKKKTHGKNEPSKQEEGQCACGLLFCVDIWLTVFKNGATTMVVVFPRRLSQSHFICTWGWSLDFDCSNCPLISSSSE